MSARSAARRDRRRGRNKTYEKVGRTRFGPLSDEDPTEPSDTRRIPKKGRAAS